MSWTIVQNPAAVEGASLVASTTFAFPSNVTAGNLIHVALSFYHAGGQTAPTITDSLGNTYVIGKQLSGTQIGVAHYYAKNIAGGACTLTITSVGGNGEWTLKAMEVSGLDTTAPLGVTNSGSGAGPATALSAGGYPPAAGSLCICSASHDATGTPTWTAGTGWTAQGTPVQGFSGRALGVETQAGTGSAITGAWTMGANVADWVAIETELKLAAGSPATTYTLGAAPNPDTVSSALTATVTPNGTYTGTITVTPTGSASTGLSAQTLTWSGTSTAQTCSFTPTVAGTLTLTGTNNQTLTNPAAVNVTVNSAPNALAITTPVAHQGYQRSGGSQSIAMAGTTTGGTSIEVSRDGGTTWTLVANGSGTGTLSGGNWTGTLAAVPTGEYTLQARLGNDHATTASVAVIPVTDCFVQAGQSNMVGGAGTIFPATPYISSMPSASKLTYTAGSGVYSTPYTWAAATEPINPSVTGGGEWPEVGYFLWPLIGTMPCWFNAAYTGTSITQWQPAAAVTGGMAVNLYTFMKNGALLMAPGKPYAKCVLWWQGESDALANMSQATYYAGYQALSAQVFSDLGCKVMPCKLHDITVNLNANGSSTASWNNINAAIAQAWASDPNTIQGPDLSALVADAGGLHLTSDANLQAAACRWMRAIDQAFYAPAAGGAPRLNSARIN